MAHPAPPPGGSPPQLERAFGTLRATALNMTQVIGAGIFITIPQVLAQLQGPYALLGWIAGGLLMIFDGMIWSELGATIPGSGGSYLYLLECYGARRWGRVMAFLFIWQFLISGPLEISTAPLAIAQFAPAIVPRLARLGPKAVSVFGTRAGAELSLTVSPGTLLAVLITAGIVVLLYRDIHFLGKVTLTFWAGVLIAIAWIVVEGAIRFNPAVAFDARGVHFASPRAFWIGLGASMIPVMYSYLGYYNICYIGDEVRDPGRTIPRSILLCSILTCGLFVLVHLAMLGTIPWREALGDPLKDNLAAGFMRRIHAAWAARLITVLIIWSALGSTFTGILGYSRVPYGAARYGHFFAALARVHPVGHFPSRALLLIGGLTAFWCFFDLETIIKALITTRILEQFLGQVVGVILLRIRQPQRVRPYTMLLYPVPCLVAFVGWTGMYLAAGRPYILLGLGTLAAGVVGFLAWTAATGRWPFGPEAENPVQ